MRFRFLCVLAWAWVSVPATSKATARKKAQGLDLRTLTLDVADVRAMAFSGDGRMAITGHWNQTAKLWDSRTGVLMQTLKGHTGVVLSVALCSDGALALTGSSDGTARIWDTSKGTVLHKLAPNAGWVVSVACALEDHVVLTGSNDNRAHLWDRSTGRLLNVIGIKSTSASPVPAVVLGRNSSRAVVGYSNSSAVLIDAARNLHLQEFIGHSGWVVTAALSPDETLALTGSHDATARIWDVSTGKQLHLLQGHASQIMCVAFDPTGKTALTGSRDGTVRHWHVASGRLIKKYKALRGKKKAKKDSADSPPDDSNQVEKVDVGTSLLKGGSAAAVRFVSKSCSESDETCPSSGDAKSKSSEVAIGILAPLSLPDPDVQLLESQGGSCTESCAARAAQPSLMEIQAEK